MHILMLCKIIIIKTDLAIIQSKILFLLLDLPLVICYTEQWLNCTTHNVDKWLACRGVVWLYYYLN